LRGENHHRLEHRRHVIAVAAVTAQREEASRALDDAPDRASNEFISVSTGRQVHKGELGASSAKPVGRCDHVAATNAVKEVQETLSFLDRRGPRGTDAKT
jgi:hypothetical protein